MIGRRPRRFLVVVFATLALGPRVPAAAPNEPAAPVRAECPAFPNVPWWQGISHASVARQVESRYGGDWSVVIGAWRKQLSKLEEIRSKGATAVVKARTGRGETAKVRRIKLRDATLDGYIDNVRDRIGILRCLAGSEIEKLGVSTSSTRSAAKVAPRETEGAAPKRPAAAREKAAACVSCHGISGISGQSTIPNLAGQNELYLVKQLKEFQAGLPSAGQSFGAIGRHSRIMTPQVKNLSEADIRDLSAHFSGLRACTADGAKASRPPRPAIAAKCVECHGPYGRNVLLDVPNLAGQKKEYLERQLRAFRAPPEAPVGGGTRESRYHYVMSRVAKALEDSEVEVLSAYFAELGC